MLFRSLSNDNHGLFHLKDTTGNKIDSNYTFHFIEYDDQEVRIGYSNYVFNIPQDEISNYTLFGDFYTSGMKTDGNWRVTFPLEKAVNNYQ